jgi:hypothetical protein
MDDELATIVSAGAASLGTAMAADAWRRIRPGIAGAFRLIFLCQQAADSRVTAGGAPRETSAAVSDEPARGAHEQTNIAHSGDVFAVQHGNMGVHLPAGQRRADKR